MIGRLARVAILAGTLTSALAAPGAIAQPSSAPEELSPAARERVDAPYLSEEERRDLRLFHGIWTQDDLDTPARRARAALTVGAYDHPALSHADADALDRAEAALFRGELDQALALTEDDTSVRAARLRVEALYQLGRHDDAARAVDPIIERLAGARTEDAGEIAEGVRALLIRARIVGSEIGDGGDYRQMVALVSRARDTLDRLDWRVRLAEGMLLYEKHNRPEAAAALQEALTLNPRNAEALAMLGRLSVDAFNFDAMHAIAGRLDTLAGAMAGDAEPDAAGDADPELTPERRSAPARLIEARAWLRQRNTDEARVALAPVLSAFPAQRDALALEAATLAVAKDDGLERRLDAFEARSPGSARALFEVGRALAEARQYDDAPGYLERAVRMLPAWSDPVMELGLLELQAGRDGLAIEHLARAIELDPFNARANNSLTLARELATFEVIETEHFRIRFTPVDAVFARDMPAVLERLHDRVTGDAVGGIDHTPAQKTTIDIMPDHARFAVRITGMPDLWTIAAATGPVIAMESPREGPGKKTGPFDWARVMQHEYTHTVTLSRSRNRIPHWMTEGMSVLLEDRPRDTRTWRALDQAVAQNRLFDLRKLNVSFVREEMPGDRSLAYAQSAWMMEHINEVFGPEAPRRILDEVATGATDTEAFERVLGVPIETFLDDFGDWARAQLIEVGLGDRPGMPTLDELAARDLGEDAEASPADFDRWLDEFPGHPDVLEMRLALALQAHSGRSDESLIPLLESMIQAVPIDVSPHRMLARIYLSSDDPAMRPKALEHLEFLDAREQSTPAFASELARIYSEQGERRKAFVSSERAVMIAPFDADQREFAARVAIQAGELDAARRHIRALVDLEPDRDIHRQRLEAIDARLRDAAG